MLVNELRVGNLVQYKGKQVKVDYISFDLECDAANQINQFNADNVSPIPLTEEWLLKFGFTSDGFDGKIYTIWSKGLLSINWDGKKANQSAYNAGIMENISADILYVHELQNLYHAVNKEELCL